MTNNPVNLIGLLIVAAIVLFLASMALTSIARYMHRVWENQSPKDVQPFDGEFTEGN